jgi:hypothetical protein
MAAVVADVVAVAGMIAAILEDVTGSDIPRLPRLLRHRAALRAARVTLQKTPTTSLGIYPLSWHASSCNAAGTGVSIVQ